MSEVIRVVIVDDRPTTLENLQKLLQFESDIAVVGGASDGVSGIEEVKRLDPDVVLMDVNMPRMDGLTATEKLGEEMQAAAVILMSIQGDVDYLKRGMQAGASEFLIKPFGGDELVASVHRAAAVAARRRSAREQAAPPPPPPPPPTPVVKEKVESGIIMMMGPKGGSGVTTLAVNLATRLQMDVGGVCLVDLDLQYGDIGVLLNLQHHSNITTWAERGQEVDGELLDSCLVDGPDGLKVLLGPPSPELADLVGGEHVHLLLSALKDKFRYIVIDGGTHLGEPTLAGIDSANLVIGIVEATLPGLKNAKLFLNIMYTLRVDPDKIALVVNRHDEQVVRSLAELGNTLKFPIGIEVPDAASVIQKSVEKASPVVKTQPDSDFGRAAAEMARLVRGTVGGEIIQSAPAKPASSGSRRFGLPGVH